MSNDPQSMSDTHRRKRDTGSLPSIACENCHLSKEYLRFREEVSDRMTAGDLRMAQTEAAIARVAGNVDLIPRLIDSKFDAMISVLKTRDSISTAVRRGTDLETQTPNGRPELKIGSAAIKASTATIVSVVLMILLLGGGIAGGAYVLGEWGRPSSGRP